ncbi:hypothetical protein PHMEG_00020644 [Phytophthora megakarya]|uniref:HAT C-terminal dimerisation domain-containing protein n=1 Tax=Phytophthora megakarya TaxID=4795 RepID=A0A225VQ45_9STRA|nr:hypothetical protein PHMEG_00020644 [Phytophthora megakarya]
MEFLATMLPRDYGKQLLQSLFLVADNCSVDMDDFNADLDSVHSLMLKLRSLTSLALQAEDVTLLDVQVWFEGLVTIKPQYERFIGPQARIVHSTDFEVACVGILSGDSGRLKRGERTALEPFRRLEADSVASGAADQDASSEDEASFVEKLQKRRRLARKEPPLQHSSASNVAERFFSVARHSLQPITLEMILFLRQNSRYWNAQDIDDASR